MRTNKILCIRRNFFSMSLKEKFESHPVVWGLDYWQLARFQVMDLMKQ